MPNSFLPADFPAHWEPLFEYFLRETMGSDAAHDLEHIRRVVANARALIQAEADADAVVVLTAAWLHDCLVVPKSSPERSRASQMAADKAVAWLQEQNWPFGKLDEIAHAIAAHSYTAKIEPRTLEAKLVQDADRLDSLGAVGLARNLMLGAEMKRPFYAANDPFCDQREPDDERSALDHLFTKLFKLPALMQTATGRALAEQRAEWMKGYLAQLRMELDGSYFPGR